MMKTGAKEVKAPTLVIGRLPTKQKIRGCAVEDAKPQPMADESTPPPPSKTHGKRQAK